MRRDGRRLYLLVAATTISILLAASAQAAANPGTYRTHFSSAVAAVVALLILNLAIDTLWFAGSSYLVVRGWKRKASRLPASSTVFSSMALVGGFFIALCGAITDFAFFYEGDSINGYGFWTGHSVPIVQSSEVIWALIAIFASVYFASFAIMRFSWKTSFLPAVIVTGLNPVGWLFTLDPVYLFILPFIMFTAVLAFLMLLELGRSYRTVMDKPKEPAPWEG